MYPVYRSPTAALRYLAREIATPTTGSSYIFAVIALAHIMLGAVLQIPLDFGYVLDAALVTTVYFLLKEVADLRKKASLADSLLDTAFVGIGATYNGHDLWPLYSFGVVVILTYIHAIFYRDVLAEPGTMLTEAR